MELPARFRMAPGCRRCRAGIHGADSTTIRLTDDPEPSQLGELVTFTTVVAANGLEAIGHPGRVVQFAVDGMNVGAPENRARRGPRCMRPSRCQAARARASQLLGTVISTEPAAEYLSAESRPIPRQKSKWRSEGYPGLYPALHKPGSQG